MGVRGPTQCAHPGPQIVTALEAALTANPSVRWALIDHISSPTATLMPVAALVQVRALNMRFVSALHCQCGVLAMSHSCSECAMVPVSCRRRATRAAWQSWSTARTHQGSCRSLLPVR